MRFDIVNSNDGIFEAEGKVYGIVNSTAEYVRLFDLDEGVLAGDYKRKSWGSRNPYRKGREANKFIKKLPKDVKTMHVKENKVYAMGEMCYIVYDSETLDMIAKYPIQEVRNTEMISL